MGITIGHQEKSYGLTSSTSGSILTFGSILATRSWMDRLMLWSPGEFFRRVRVSSKVYGEESSELLGICAGVAKIAGIYSPGKR